ncbi:Hypothetical predicted protein [Cloeon dipterum]|uniref:BTB domain-containing protein n=1 Tax=Cloeon dipterum TaxID=197152 RepID=A0A8S1D0W9_9INSE|nr:Hypothetical predicted protein [Cloeon dipterum]
MSSEEEFETIKMFDCDWRSGKTLTEQILFMYEKQLGFDLKISVKGDNKQKTFQCHKLIVRRLTPVFDQTLNESGYGSLSLDIGNLDPDIFAAILTYAYTDKLDFENMLDMKDVIAVHKVASLYQMDVVRQQCNKLFLVKMNKNNVWDLLTLMEEQPDVDLESRLRSFLSMSVSGCLKSRNFLNCGLKVLEFILDQEELPVAEVKLVKSVIRWAKHKVPELTPEKSKELLGPCLGKLRFLCLTPTEFSEVVAPSGLLPQDDCYFIVFNLISGIGEMPLPDNICKLDTPRIKLQDEPIEPDWLTPSSSSSSSEEQRESPTFPPKVEPSAAPEQTNSTNEASSTSEETDYLLFRRPADPTFLLKRFLLEAPATVSVYIEVSKAATFKGVRIASQKTPAGCKPGTYKEDMYVRVVSISNVKNPVTGVTPTRKEVVYKTFVREAENGLNKYFDVMFKKPCMLEANQKYVMHFSFRKPGQYLLSKRLDADTIKGYTVKFSVPDPRAHGADPVQAIFLELQISDVQITIVRKGPCMLLSAIREALDEFFTVVGISNKMSSVEEIEIDCNWRSGKTLMEQLWFMYEKQLGVDLKIAVVSDHKQKTFQCHKMIVRRLTPVFDQTLNESSDGFLSLDIGNLDPAIFSLILMYAYTDKLNFENMDMKDVIAVHKVASLYQMDVIRQHCNKVILVKMNKNNVWDLLFLVEELPDVDLECSLRSFLSMSVTGCLDSPNFLDCGLKVLQFILDQEELPVAEVKLVKSVIRWAKHKVPELTPEKSKELLGPCLGKLRFLCLTPAEFSELVAPSGLLLHDDCLSILVNLISGNKTMPLPDHICKLDTPRIKLQDEPIEEDLLTPSPSPSSSSEEQRESPTFPPKVEPSAATEQTNSSSEVENKKAASTSGEMDYLLVRRPADPKFQLTMFLLQAPATIGVYIEVSKAASFKGVRIASQETPAGCEPGTYQEETSSM